mgnify:CR=1 FL=1
MNFYFIPEFFFHLFYKVVVIQHSSAGKARSDRIEGKPGDVTVEMESRGFTPSGDIGVVGRVKLK